ncbi:unnamed protein product [Bursaphelenchus okinawaensis]|uniref:RRM domain-containing protein n=1 Tax=Bursaphelenchus okinawaensis TaxID=465554 RepID=A0A811LPB0_9BILA|nr:unnamed protein product [Bursaphelenchus okinawaensis]CAG9127069.1 unnamed protein product [Bursaphelenchus okinawaensis]
MLHIPNAQTIEEKNLKKTFELIRNVRKEIENAQKAQHLGTAKKNTDGQDLDQNMAEVKKKLAKGVIKVAKDEKHTFKRLHGQKRESVNYVEEPISISTEQQSTSEMFSPKNNNNETNNTNLYIRGFELDYNLMRETFSQFGNVVRCYVEEHKRSGFINFATPEEAEAAIRQLNGQRVGQSNLRVEFARKRDNSKRPSKPYKSFSQNSEDGAAKRARTMSTTSDDQRAVVSYEDGEIFD